MSLFIRHHGLYFFQKYFYVRLFESDWLWCQRHWLFDSQWLHWLLIPRTSGCALMSHVLECRQVLNAFVECVRWMLPQSLFIGLSQPLPFLVPVSVSPAIRSLVSCPSTLELSFSLWNGVPSELLGLLAGGGTRVLRVTLVMCISCGESSVPVVCVDGNMTPVGKISFFPKCLQRIPLRRK